MLRKVFIGLLTCFDSSYVTQTRLNTVSYQRLLGPNVALLHSPGLELALPK